MMTGHFVELQAKRLNAIREGRTVRALSRTASAQSWALGVIMVTLGAIGLRKQQMELISLICFYMVSMNDV